MSRKTLTADSYADMRYLLEAGRLVTDKQTGDQFVIAGRNVPISGALCCDPTRLDTLTRHIVDMLNIAEKLEHRT